MSGICVNKKIYRNIYIFYNNIQNAQGWLPLEIMVKGDLSKKPMIIPNCPAVTHLTVLSIVLNICF